MSADRPGGLWQRWFLAVGGRYLGVFDGGGVGDGASVPDVGTVRLQLTVWEQRL